MQLIAELVGHVFETLLGRGWSHASCFGTGAPAVIFVNISIYIYTYDFEIVGKAHCGSDRMISKWIVWIVPRSLWATKSAGEPIYHSH